MYYDISLWYSSGAVGALIYPSSDRARYSSRLCFGARYYAMSSRTFNTRNEVSAFSQSLLEGPSSALEHLRGLYYTSRQSPACSQGELAAAMSALSPQLKVPELGLDGELRASADTAALLGSELWRACISSDFPILLLEMIQDPHFCTGSSVRLISQFA